MNPYIFALISFLLVNATNYTTISSFAGQVYIFNTEDESFSMDATMYYDSENGQQVLYFSSIKHLDGIFKDSSDPYHTYHRLNTESNVANHTHAVFYNFTYDSSTIIRSLTIYSQDCNEYAGVSPYLDYVYTTSNGDLCRICLETGKCYTFKNYGALTTETRSQMETYITQMQSTAAKNDGKAAKVLLMIDPSFGGSEAQLTAFKDNLRDTLTNIVFAKTKDGDITNEVGIVQYSGSNVAFTSVSSTIETAIANIVYSSSESTVPLSSAINMINNYTGNITGRTIIVSFNRDTAAMKTLVAKYNTTLRSANAVVYSVSYDSTASSDRLTYTSQYTTARDKLYFYYSTYSSSLLYALVAEPMMHVGTRFLSNHMCKSCYGYCQLGNGTTELSCKSKSPDDKEALDSNIFTNGCDYKTATSVVYKVVGGAGMFALAVVALVELLLVLLQRILCGSGRKVEAVDVDGLNVSNANPIYEGEDNEATNPLFVG
ncbi:VWFA domain-containing protein [Entamoeba marina]